MFMRVVFPAPFSPTSPCTSPLSTEKSTWSFARTCVDAKYLVMPFISIAGVICTSFKADPGNNPGVCFYTTTVRLFGEQFHTFGSFRRERIANLVFTVDDLRAPFFHKRFDLRDFCGHIGWTFGFKGGLAFVPGKTGEAFL